ncbi:hypothetical protein EIN_040820, partial [Entamoeba invadens IP1]
MPLQELQLPQPWSQFSTRPNEQGHCISVGVLAEIEEIRENRVTEIVGGLHVCAKAISQRKLIEWKLDEQIVIIVIQDTIHIWYHFRNWVWFRLFQKVRPILKKRRVDEEFAAKDKEIEALKKKLAEEIAKSEAVEKALSEMKIKNIDLETLKESVITELNKDIEDKEGEISDLKKKLEAEEDNSKDLETQLHEKENIIADLEKQVKKLQNTISGVNAQNEDTGTKDKLEADAENTNGKKYVQEKQLSQLKADNDNLTKAKFVVDAKLEDAEREKAALNEENFDYLKKNADTDAADKKKLNGTVNKSNKKIEELSAKVDELTGVITKIEQEVVEANEELETVK